ncbi:MAG: hypothetical protein IPK83_19345 [Planctomycetes bacterium]|nr:hypothetical protein [Planctomycetota bacterium]
MAREHNAFKLGLFTIIVVSVFFGVLMWISKGVEGDMKPLVIRFKPTTVMPPLAKGSSIFVGGQKVGKVHSSALISDTSAEVDKPSYFVQVEAEIRSDITLRADCSAFAEVPPLGGDGIIKIDIGKADELFRGDVLVGSDAVGFAAILASMQAELNAADPSSLMGQLKMQLDPDSAASLMAKLHQSLADVNSMTASLSHELTPAEKATLISKFHEIADNVAEATGSLRREFDSTKPNVTVAKLHMAMDAINSGLTVLTRVLATGESPITNTLLNVEATSEHLRDETDAEMPASLMAHLKETSILINTALADINTVTKTTRDVLVLNRENINRMLVNFKESSDHIKTGLKYVLRNPWRLINAPTPAELQQQVLFDAARSFSEAASRIDDASAQLRALAELHDGKIPIDDPDLKRIQADLTKSAELYERAEAEVWKQLGGK